ncbi:Spy0128 family protein, partial [Enterococcus sp. LJL128]
MVRIRKIWSVTLVLSILLGFLPIQAIAETVDGVGIQINEASLTDYSRAEINQQQRINAGDQINVKLKWSLDKSGLIEQGQTIGIALPENLYFSEQSGMLANNMGSYYVANQRLSFLLNKNYVSSQENEQIPDFSSVVFYEGEVELIASTSDKNQQEEFVDFGNNVVKPLYYKQVNEETIKSSEESEDPKENSLLIEESIDGQEELKSNDQLEMREARAHESNLNSRGVKLFTNVKITDFNGQEFSPSNPALKDANIKIHFDWVLDDLEEIKAGDYYTYQLPDYFSIHNLVSGELKNATNQVLGNFSVDLNGLLTVTFNSVGENLSERQGTIDLTTELNITSEKEVVTIETGITDNDGKEITIVFPVVKADIVKTGVINNDNTVVWTIVINEKREALKNVVITDYLPEGLTYHYASAFVQNGNGEWVSAPAGFTQLLQTGANTITFSFPNNEILDEPVKLEIRMRVTDKNKTEFVNKATITGDNFLGNSSEASVSYADNSNYKRLLAYDLDKGTFNWEVKATYTEAGGSFKDWLYAKNSDPSISLHYLLKNTLEIYDESGNLLGSDKWSLAQTNGDYAEKNGELVHFTLNFVDKGTYLIKYTTKAFDLPVRPNTTIPNYATVIDGSNREELSAGETVKLDSKLGVKKLSTGSTQTDHSAGWLVKINENRIQMNNAVITDKFETLEGAYPSALQLIPSTLEVTADDGTTTKTLEMGAAKDYVLEALAGDPTYKKGFRIKLLNSYASTTDTITIKYRTHYHMDEQIIGMDGLPVNRFSNSVTISYTGEDGNTYTDGSESTIWVDLALSYNGVKYGTYVAKNDDVANALKPAPNPFEAIAPTDSVYWTVLLNTWQTKIPIGTTIREELGEGQTLRDIKIYDVTMDATGVKVKSLDKEWQLGTDYGITMDNGVPVITLLSERTQAFAVYVSADASADVYKYKNIAFMDTLIGNQLKVEGFAEKSEKNDWIDKDGSQDGGNHRLVNWSVVMNKDSHTIHNPIVTDTVNISEQSFVYDASKDVIVSIYKAKKDPSGNFIKDGAALVFDEADKPVVTLDAAAGTQTLNIKLGDMIDSPYIIEYQTILDPGIRNNEIISNKAVLSGKDIQIEETTKVVTVKSTDGVGTSSGKNGSLIFRKIDENNNLITSDSAFFDLYRRDSNGVLTLLMQDIEVKGDKIIINGTEIDSISNLRYGDYAIIESQAPDGYEKDAAQHDFTISKNQVEYTFSLENKKKVVETTAKLEAKKELSGRVLQADEFEFRLTGNEDSVNQRKKNDGTGLVAFDEIKYDTAGIYTYTISEVIPDTKETGMSYDQAIYEATVTVADKGGQLEAKVTYKNVASGEVPTFKNEYKALAGSAKLEAKKELSGRALQADEFEFRLTGNEDSVNQRKKNDGTGLVAFDEIKYDTAGIYTYTISEVIPDTKETGMSYDQAIYEATVTVADKGGQLEAKVTYKNV